MTNKESKRRPRFFEGERLLLTPSMIEDAELMFLWYNDRETLFLVGPGERPRTLVRQKALLEERVGQKRDQTCAIIFSESGDQVGHADVFEIREPERMVSCAYRSDWIPACAGMTLIGDMLSCVSSQRRLEPRQCCE